MTFEIEKEAYDRHGFVIVRGFLAEAEFAELRTNVDRYLRDVVPTLPDADAFYEDRGRPETLKQLQRMGSDSFFNEYSQHPKWLALAEALVGEPVIVQQPEWFNKPPGTNHVHAAAPGQLLFLSGAVERRHDLDGSGQRRCRKRLPAIRGRITSERFSTSRTVEDSGVLSGDYRLRGG